MEQNSKEYQPPVRGVDLNVYSFSFNYQNKFYEFKSQNLDRKNPLSFIYLGHGSYNDVFKITLENKDKALKIPSDSFLTDINFSLTDEPKRSVRVYNEIHCDLIDAKKLSEAKNIFLNISFSLSPKKEKNKSSVNEDDALQNLPKEKKHSRRVIGWISDYFEKTNGSITDREYLLRLKTIKSLTGRVIVDPFSRGNFIKKSSGDLICVDVGFALLTEETSITVPSKSLKHCTAQAEQIKSQKTLMKTTSFSSFDQWLRIQNDFDSYWSTCCKAWPRTVFWIEQQMSMNSLMFVDFKSKRYQLRKKFLTQMVDEFQTIMNFKKEQQHNCQGAVQSYSDLPFFKQEDKNMIISFMKNKSYEELPRVIKTFQSMYDQFIQDLYPELFTQEQNHQERELQRESALETNVHEDKYQSSSVPHENLLSSKYAKRSSLNLGSRFSPDSNKESSHKRLYQRNRVCSMITEYDQKLSDIDKILSEITPSLHEPSVFEKIFNFFGLNKEKPYQLTLEKQKAALQTQEHISLKEETESSHICQTLTFRKPRLQESSSQIFDFQDSALRTSPEDEQDFQMGYELEDSSHRTSFETHFDCSEDLPKFKR